jgi:hypothetical protein
MAKQMQATLLISLSCALLACSAPRAVRVSTVDAEPKAASVTTSEAAPVQDFAVENPKVYAVDLLPSSMIAGVQYEVAPELRLQGAQAEFLIKSDYGRLDAVSVEIAQQRIAEIAALAELERMSELKVFGKAAKNSIRRTGTALYNVFRDPEATAKSIPSGIRDKMSRTWDNIKLKGKQLSDDARSKIRDESAPPEFNAFLADPPSVPEKTWEDRAQSQGKKFGLSYIGYNSARRELTKTLQIDPYTSNPQIEDRLDAFAWSYLAGGAATGVTLGAITGGASVVVSKARQINNIVYDLPPEDVRKRNADELKKIGIDGDVARFFLRNSTFTPTLQTAIVDVVTQNWTADGWRELMQYLRYVDSEVEARYIVNALRMAQTQHQTQPVVKAVMLIGVTPTFVLADDTVLLPVPADFVHYNAKLKAFLGEPQLRERRVRMDVAGKVSPIALERIRAHGWDVRAGVRFEGAPDYAEVLPVEAEREHALPVPEMPMEVRQDPKSIDGRFESDNGDED